MTSPELIKVVKNTKDWNPNVIPFLKAYKQLVEKEQLENLLEDMRGANSECHIDIVKEELDSINSNLLT